MFQRSPVGLRASVFSLTILLIVLVWLQSGSVTVEGQDHKDATLQNAEQLIAEGRKAFRFDTFGDEEFWGGAVQLHRAIAGANSGGVGPGLTPRAAVGLGLKVDVDALPPELVQQLRSGAVNLDDPSTTLALLKMNAVVGITGFFDSSGSQLTSVGIQCALCHSTVNDSLQPGIGSRLDAGKSRPQHRCYSRVSTKLKAGQRPFRS